MWSLTSLRTKRMSSFRKFRLLPPKDFFDSIDPQRTWWRHRLNDNGDIVALPRSF